MSYQRSSQPKPGLRHPSMGPHDSASTGQSRMLVARINEKKAELENLKQLRDLSGGLAAQMQALEEKLSTLSEGTEGWTRHFDDAFQNLTMCLQQRWLLFYPIGITFCERSTWHQVGNCVIPSWLLQDSSNASENTEAHSSRRRRKTWRFNRYTITSDFGSHTD